MFSFASFFAVRLLCMRYTMQIVVITKSFSLILLNMFLPSSNKVFSLSRITCPILEFKNIDNALIWRGVNPNKINNNFKVTAEIYYGEKRTRYYYEEPDKTYTIDVSDSVDYVSFSKVIKFEKAVDFV